MSESQNAPAQTPAHKIMSKSQDPEAAENVQTTEAPAVDLPRLVRLFPVPWSFDVFAHPAPKYSKAPIYAADSTRIAQTFGADSEGLAQLIVTAVNQYLPNDKSLPPADTTEKR